MDLEPIFRKIGHMDLSHPAQSQDSNNFQLVDDGDSAEKPPQLMEIFGSFS